MSRAQSVDAIWNGIRDSAGNALSGGKIYTYYSGTTTPITLYSASDKSTSCTNPIVLDSNGKAKVWADGAYKFVITTSADASVDTLDGLLYGLSDTVTSWCGNSSGSADAYVLTPSPAISAYTNGLTLSFAANFSNSGASTINLSGLGAKSVKNGAGSALSSGDITSGNIVTVTYDTTAGYFILNTSNSFTTIAVSGAGTFGSVVSPILQGAGAIAVKPSGTAKWNFSATTGHLIPETNDNVTLGDSTHHVLSAHIKSILVAAGQTLNFGSGASATWSLSSSNHILPAADDTYNLGSNSARIANGYFNTVNATSLAAGASGLFFGPSGGGWVVDTSSVLFPYGTTGTVDLGKSSKRLQNIYLKGKIAGTELGAGVTAVSYSYSGTDAFAAVRSINWDAVTCGTGSEGVTRSTLNSCLLSLARAVATIWKDYYGSA